MDMDKDAACAKARCVLVNPDVEVPGCVCVPPAEVGGGDEEGDVEEEQAQEGQQEEQDEEGSLNYEDEEAAAGDDEDGKGHGLDQTVKQLPPDGIARSKPRRSTRGYDPYGHMYDDYDLYGEYPGEYRDYLLRMSEISGEEEGQVVEDYMRFFLEVEEPCIPGASLSTSEASEIEPVLQRTIAIIKPEAMVYKDVILRAVFEAGFQIVGRRFVHLTPEQVSEIYTKYYGSPSFPHLVLTVSSGPVLVMSLAALDVISRWKKLIGPDGSVMESWFFPISMRKRFGLQRTIGNALHGSENCRESNKENRYFYPNSILEPILKDKLQVADYHNLYINPTLLNGLTELVKKKPIDPILFLADWLLKNNPFQPRLPYQIAITPT